MVAINETASEYKNVSAGIHPAVCYGSIHVGTQHSDFGSKEKVILLWEIHDELTDDGKPLTISKEYNMTFNEKSTITKDLQTWVGAENCKAGFDTDTLVGKPVQLIISEKPRKDGKGNRVEVSACVAYKPNQETPKLINSGIKLSLYDFDQQVFDLFVPKWIKRKIALSPEFAELVASGRAAPFVEAQ